MHALQNSNDHMNSCSMVAVYVLTFWAASVAFFLQVVASTPASVASCKAAVSVFECSDEFVHDQHIRYTAGCWHKQVGSKQCANS